jgi:hypothetical protein
MSEAWVTFGFRVLAILAVLGFLVYFSKIYRRVRYLKDVPADEESRKMYFETFKAVVTAAGLGIPVIGTTLSKGPGPHLWMLQWAALYLLGAVAFAVITLLEMSRRYERQRTLLPDAEPEDLTKATNAILAKLTPAGESKTVDYPGALKLVLDYCRAKTPPPGLTSGLEKGEVLALCVWAYFSSVGFIMGLLYVVRFVVCFQIPAG